MQLHRLRAAVPDPKRIRRDRARGLAYVLHRPSRENIVRAKRASGRSRARHPYDVAALGYDIPQRVNQLDGVKPDRPTLRIQNVDAPTLCVYEPDTVQLADAAVLETSLDRHQTRRLDDKRAR